MYTDPIADYLTRVRNAQMAGHKVVDIPASNMKKSITQILHDKGYILTYKFEDTVALLGYKINHRFNIGYSYGLPSTKASNYYTGSHEFILGVKLAN